LNVAQVAGSTVDLQPNLYKYILTGAKVSDRPAGP
jgi:hypothetical protein